MMFKRLALIVSTLMAIAAISTFAPGPAPVQAQSTFDKLWHDLFRSPKPKRRTMAPKEPEEDVVDLPKQAGQFARPALSFAFAHQSVRHKRFRYSHHTPYGYYGHPYRHGFAAHEVASSKPRRRAPRRTRSRNRTNIR